MCLSLTYFLLATYLLAVSSALSLLEPPLLLVNCQDGRLNSAHLSNTQLPLVADCRADIQKGHGASEARKREWKVGNNPWRSQKERGVWEQEVGSRMQDAGDRKRGASPDNPEGRWWRFWWAHLPRSVRCALPSPVRREKRDVRSGT